MFVSQNADLIHEVKTLNKNKNKQEQNLQDISEQQEYIEKQLIRAYIQRLKFCENIKNNHKLNNMDNKQSVQSSDMLKAIADETAINRRRYEAEANAIISSLEQEFRNIQLHTIDPEADTTMHRIRHFCDNLRKSGEYHGWTNDEVNEIIMNIRRDQRWINLLYFWRNMIYV